jgi:hypothetical protein
MRYVPDYHIVCNFFVKPFGPITIFSQIVASYHNLPDIVHNILAARSGITIFTLIFVTLFNCLF